MAKVEEERFMSGQVPRHASFISRTLSLDTTFALYGIAIRVGEKKFPAAFTESVVVLPSAPVITIFAQCPASKPSCDRRTGTCTECLTSLACGATQVCDPATLTCRAP